MFDFILKWSGCKQKFVHSFISLNLTSFHEFSLPHFQMLREFMLLTEFTEIFRMFYYLVLNMFNKYWLMFLGYFSPFTDWLNHQFFQVTTFKEAGI